MCDFLRWWWWGGLESLLRSVRLLCGPGGRGRLCVGGGAWSCVVAKFLHVFHHDVEGDGDEALGLNTSHCKHTNMVLVLVKLPKFHLEICPQDVWIKKNGWNICFGFKCSRKSSLSVLQTFSAFTLGHDFRVCVFRATSQQPAATHDNKKRWFKKRHHSVKTDGLTNWCNAPWTEWEVYGHLRGGLNPNSHLQPHQRTKRKCMMVPSGPPARPGAV